MGPLLLPCQPASQPARQPAHGESDGEAKPAALCCSVGAWSCSFRRRRCLQNQNRMTQEIYAHPEIEQEVSEERTDRSNHDEGHRNPKSETGKEKQGQNYVQKPAVRTRRNSKATLKKATIANPHPPANRNSQIVKAYDTAHILHLV